jgi:hypothetical protein
MGQELLCRVAFGDQAAEGKALLETSEILFRGSIRLRIPFRQIESLEVGSPGLTVTWPEGMAVFDIDEQTAAKWAHTIRNPRSLIEKLGVRPGDRVTVVGVADEGFAGQVLARTDDVSFGELQPESDFIFYAADHIDALTHLEQLRGRIKENGAIWVVSRKGKAATLKDVEVMAAARSAGLVDTKVVSFSETHSALKLVIPAELRSKPRKR